MKKCPTATATKRQKRCISSTTATKEDIVKLLCDYVGEESLPNGKTNIIYTCPSNKCKNELNQVRFLKGSGYTNPYNHLKTCLCNGNVDALIDLYNTNFVRKEKCLNPFFRPVLSVTDKEQCLLDWIELVIDETLPASVIKKESFRAFKGEPNVNITQETFKEVLYTMTEIIEQRISKEMKTAGRGSILHDGWSKNGTHYVGLFACYLREVGHINHRNKLINIMTPEVVLLSCAPMSQVAEIEDEENEEDVEEATSFNAEVHAHHIRSTFNYYQDIEFDCWVKAQTADNAKVNVKTCKLLGIPHIPCKNHLLNSEVNNMVETNRDMNDKIETVQKTMKQCKRSIKNMAILRKISDFSPVLYNKTRWSGKHYVLKRFVTMRDDLIEAQTEEQSNFEMNASPAFFKAVKKYEGWMKEINLATKQLQTSQYTLSQCRFVLQYLIDNCNRQRSNKESCLYGIRLGTLYIASDSVKVSFVYIFFILLIYF